MKNLDKHPYGAIPVLFVFTLILLFSLTACRNEQPENETRYDKIARYVTNNLDLLDPVEDVEFYDFTVDGEYYGYYYSRRNEILLPDRYSESTRGDLEAALHKTDDGYCFGDPNGTTDWCFVKPITDQWFYYELHWG